LSFPNNKCATSSLKILTFILATKLKYMRRQWREIRKLNIPSFQNYTV
jgi:hypothetical protein